jgi:type IV pilus assembly protein PilV
MNGQTVQKGEAGFTLVEIIIAIVVFSIGVLAIAAGSGAAYRMLGHGRRATQAGVMATQRIELLRRTANSTSPRCTSLANGSATYSNGFSEAWRVTGSGNSRNVVAQVTYPTAQGTTSDSILTIIPCL